MGSLVLAFTRRIGMLLRLGSKGRVIRAGLRLHWCNTDTWYGMEFCNDLGTKAYATREHFEKNGVRASGQSGTCWWIGVLNFPLEAETT